MFWFIFCGSDLLVTEDHCIPRGKNVPISLKSSEVPHFFSKIGDEDCFWVIIDEPPCSSKYKMVNLRESYSFLPFSHYLLAGKAKELIYWHQNTRFCGYCGGPTKFETAISKRCSICGKEWWPSLAIAIIVAVKRDNRLLMVQSKKFRRDYMGLVAGFVETGETLEEAVKREVLEETGIHIKDIQYFSSQPWPYPSGLMVGFTANYDKGELKIQKSELKKGGWYTADHMPSVPGKLSIARMLIDHFVEEQGAPPLQEVGF